MRAQIIQSNDGRYHVRSKNISEVQRILTRVGFVQTGGKWKNDFATTMIVFEHMSSSWHACLGYNIGPSSRVKVKTEPTIKDAAGQPMKLTETEKKEKMINIMRFRVSAVKSLLSELEVMLDTFENGMKAETINLGYDVSHVENESLLLTSTAR